MLTASKLAPSASQDARMPERMRNGDEKAKGVLTAEEQERESHRLVDRDFQRPTPTESRPISR